VAHVYPGTRGVWSPPQGFGSLLIFANVFYQILFASNMNFVSCGWSSRMVGKGNQFVSSSDSSFHSFCLPRHVTGEPGGFLCQSIDVLRKGGQSGRRLSLLGGENGANYLEDHPRTCKWLITMVSKFPK